MILQELLDSSAGVSKRFLADESRFIALDSIDRPERVAPGPDPLSGRSVLLACDGQLASALALIRLDGAARRIVLRPPDVADRHLPHIIEQAGVDLVVADGALPQSCGCPVIPIAELGALARDAPQPGRTQTEWVLFTSGTTGQPKMVAHTLRSLAGHLPSGPLGGRPTTWCTFYDVRRYGGLQILLRALVGGGSLVLSSAKEPPAGLLVRAGERGATHFLGTPSHWRRALMTGEGHRISPQYVRLSGEIADQAILDALHALYPRAKVVHAFATTETGVGFEVDDGRAGFPADILHRSDGEVHLRVQDGTLQVRSRRVAARRIGGAADDLADADGFVDTGDVVERRGDRCYFAGRKEGIINVGGQKVHPEEVETVINQHPGVRMSLVRSRPSPITGAVVVADLVPRNHPGDREAELTGEVLALCRRDLAAHKVPAIIRIVASLGIAASGKLVRSDA